MNFKVGDRVIFIGDCSKHIASNELEKVKEEKRVLKISEISGIGTIYCENTDWSFSHDELQLIKNKKPTLEELEEMPAGTKITTDRDNDNVFIKIESDNLEFYSIEDNENLDRWDIEDDLFINDEDLGTKIIKIEIPKEYETVYEYANEVQEMTVAEIEKALGHPVKIVKEEN